MTAPTLQRFSPYAVDGGCDAYGQMEEDEFGDYYNREDADAALDAAQARIAALEKVAKTAFGLVCHDQWGTHMYTDDGMWSDAQKLIDALSAIYPPASDTRA